MTSKFEGLVIKLWWSRSLLCVWFYRCCLCCNGLTWYSTKYEDFHWINVNTGKVFTKYTWHKVFFVQKKITLAFACEALVGPILLYILRSFVQVQRHGSTHFRSVLIFLALFNFALLADHLIRPACLFVVHSWQMFCTEFSWM